MPYKKPTVDKPLDRRRAGILLHPTSLPGPEQHGIIGHDAFRFIEFLAKAGISIWQTLPLGPTHNDKSPYQCLSAHAIDPGFISLEWLYDRHLLKQDPALSRKANKQQLLQEAFSVFKQDDNNEDFQKFTQQHDYWLGDFCTFMAIRETQDNKAWWDWDKPLRNRETKAIKVFADNYRDLIEYFQFIQFVVFNQWLQLKSYANQHGVLIFGDLPIYVALDSADVWANRKQFALDKNGNPTSVAGVPPDYFSETGQRWGNPLYSWSKMKKEDFQWWVDRMRSQYELFDLIRIDHFRGLQAYWEVPAEEETAMNGKWVEAPGQALLNMLQSTFGSLPLVAEDLGTITEEVHELRHSFNIPGMKILQFAFDRNPDNPYLPHNHERDSVVYTGTHDNDTTLAWYEELNPELQDYICQYLGCEKPKMPWMLIHTALMSVAKLAIIPMQDILGLGKGFRMNTPGTTEGNWTWRFSWQQIQENLTQELHHLNVLYNRCR
jgi:4-alpha-glucanotransferase